MSTNQPTTMASSNTAPALFSLDGIVTDSILYVSKKDSSNKAILTIKSSDGKEFKFYDMLPSEVQKFQFGDRITVTFSKSKNQN